MSLKGVIGKIAWVDLTTGTTTIEKPEDELYSKYLGGYGLGAYYLFTRQPKNVDPLGPENTLGFITGPLTGTDAITGNRFTVVGKSPKSGGWGDANCGGKFGPALKQASLDGIFFTGISKKPVYVLIEDNQVTLHDASSYWGLSCPDAEDKFREAHGKNAHAAVIGPAGERLSALAAIINDKGRAAGRSGLGQVMGSKLLKGVVAVGTGKVQVDDEKGLIELRKRILKEYYHDENLMYGLFHNFGTPGVLEPAVLSQDAPIKNWSGTVDDFPEYENIAAEQVLALKKKTYGCWKCPMACGDHVKVSSGPYAGEGHKPEYETLASFGSMCLNHNLESICYANNICNEFGLDTISAGATVAFAMECYDHGVITKDDLGGIELRWGNHEAIAKFTEELAKGEGFVGKVFGNGVKKAVEHLGTTSSDFAMECGGEELPMHDPRCTPGYALGYASDATPGRHTQWGAAYAESSFVPPELDYPQIEDRFNYSAKGKAHKYISSYGHIVNVTGLCLFGAAVTPATAIPEYLTFAMGKDFTMEELLEIGERIANLRVAFNLREGIRNNRDYRIPQRVLGQPPLQKGPVKGVVVDNDSQIRDYFVAMGWNPETGVPARAIFERLGLDFAAEVTEP
jgi:aldehyde:ferredoxin oxidoreductase